MYEHMTSEHEHLVHGYLNNVIPAHPNVDELPPFRVRRMLMQALSQAFG